mmetsp:Transcript_44167/g.66580  ORF Transcript_44167/g.66580 Transcript_44167/m.66580 type:complete len:102 (-) Transcript_44167:1961-2266(-)
MYWHHLKEWLGWNRFIEGCCFCKFVLIVSLFLAAALLNLYLQRAHFIFFVPQAILWRFLNLWSCRGLKISGQSINQFYFKSMYSYMPHTRQKMVRSKIYQE